MLIPGAGAVTLILGAALTLAACGGGEPDALRRTSPTEQPESGLANAPLLEGMASWGSGPQRPTRETEPCRVTRVVDGDTLRCDPLGRIRLIGIDAPELDQSPFGPMAREVLASIAPVGSTVEIEPDVERTDRYGRVLAHLWTDAGLVNWIVVRGGYALVTTVPPNVQHVDALEEAQRAAREAGDGLWGIDGFSCAPAAHRARRCP